MSNRDSLRSVGTDGSEAMSTVDVAAEAAQQAPSLPVVEDHTDAMDTVGSDSPAHKLAELRHDPDTVRRLFETGEYPDKAKFGTKDYESHKAELQVELLKVQDWARATGQKIVVLFEGRDGAGKRRHDKALHGAPQSARGACRRVG